MCIRDSFKGKDVGTILAEVLGGTKVVPTLNNLREKYGSGTHETGNDEPAEG